MRACVRNSSKLELGNEMRVACAVRAEERVVEVLLLTC